MKALRIVGKDEERLSGPDFEYVTLLTQRITIHYSPLIEGIEGEGENVHAHRLYGEYQENDQQIILDSGMGFERMRETLLHENLHAMLAVTQLDTILLGESAGLDEHIVSTLAPVLLAWLRENPEAVAYLSEEQ